MKAVIYEGTRKVRVENIPAPKPLAETNVIIRVTAASICGTDIRLYWGTMTNVMPMSDGEPLGPESVGVIEEIGKAVTGLSGSC